MLFRSPCREGTWWVTRVLGRIEAGAGRPEDLPLLEEVGGNILFKAFCALADGAVSPLASTLTHFRDEYDAHIRDGRCPLDASHPRATDAPVGPAPAEPPFVPLSEVLR